MLMLKPLGWQSSLIHPPLGQQSVLGRLMPLGTTSETIAQTFPVLQLALEQRESSSESDQSVEWFDWNWDKSSEPSDTVSPSSAILDPPIRLAPSAESSTFQPSSITEPQAQSFTDSFKASSQDPPDQFPAAKFELLHPQITRKPLGVDSPLGYRDPLELTEPTLEANFPFYTTEPTAPAESPIQRFYEEPTVPKLSSPALLSEIAASSATNSEVEVETAPEITEPPPAPAERNSSRSDQALAQSDRSIDHSETETESVAAQSSNRPILSETDSQSPPDFSDTLTDSTISLDSLTVSSTKISTPSTEQPELIESVDSTQVAEPVNPSETDVKEPVQLAAEPIVEQELTSSTSSPTLLPEIAEPSATEPEVETEAEAEITEPPSAAEGTLSNSDQALAQPEQSIARLEVETHLAVETRSEAETEAETESVAAQPDEQSVLPETDSQSSSDSLTIPTQPNQELGNFSTLSRSIEETAISTSSTTASETDQPSNQAASAENSDLVGLANLSDVTRSSKPSALPLDSLLLSTIELTSSVTTDSTTPSDITTDSTVPPDSLTVSSTEISTPSTEQPELIESVDSTQVAEPVKPSETDVKEPIQLATESIVDRINEPIPEVTVEPSSELIVPTESNPGLNLRIDPVSTSVDEYATQSRSVTNERSFTSSDSAVDSSNEIPGADLETRSLPETAPELTSELALELINPVRDETPTRPSSLERVQPSIQLAGESANEQITESISEQSAELVSEAIKPNEMNSVLDAEVNSAVSNADEYFNQSINSSETITQPLASIHANDSTSLHLQPAPIENDLILENSLTSDATSPAIQPEFSESQASPLSQTVSSELQHSSTEEAQLQSIETTASGQTPEQAKASLLNKSLSQTQPIQAKLDPDPPEILDLQNRIDQIPSAQLFDQANERTSVESSDSESANLQTSIETNGHQPTLEPVNPQTDIPETTQASQDIVQFDRNPHQTDASTRSAQPIPDSWSSLSELIAADSAQSAPWQETLDSLDAIAQSDIQPDQQSEASPPEPQDKADTDEQTVIQTQIDSPTSADSLDASSDFQPDSKPAPQSPTDEQLDQIATIIYSQLRRQFEIDRERQGRFLSGHALWLGEVIVAERAGAKFPDSFIPRSQKNEIDLMLPNATLDKLTAEIHALLKRQIELDRERNSLYF